MYDPHTNGAGWVAMKGVPASLTKVEARSAEELRNFYPAPRETREEPQATRSPPEEVAVSHEPPKAETPRRKTGTVEANMDWDTDDVQDRSRSPSPSAGIGAITLGESAEDVSPPGQDTRLVTDHIVEPGVVPPQENALEAEEKSPVDAPSDDQQTEFCEAMLRICMPAQKNYKVIVDIKCPTKSLNILRDGIIKFSMIYATNSKRSC